MCLQANEIMASHIPYIVITPCDETLDTGKFYYEIYVTFSASYVLNKSLHLYL